MLSASPARLLRRTVPVLTLALFLCGCADAPEPLAPHVPLKPNALVGPVAVVTNTDDAGPGSLRQAILDATAGTTIQFGAAIAGQTIALTSAPLDVDKSLVIEGPVPQGMIISGSLSIRVVTCRTDLDLVMRNVSIVNGRSDNGAGVFVLCRLTLDHVLVADNEATFEGGGIFVKSTGSLTLLNSTVSGNVARSMGGGIGTNGSMAVRNSTIAANVSATSGGIEVGEGDASMRNSIIAGNTNFALEADNCSIAPGSGFAFSGRNFSNDGSCGDEETNPDLLVDPQLAPLASNGGPTKTHALLASSPAIDAGTLCSEATDQRYVARDVGRSCDVGAFEFTDFGTYTLTIGPNVAVNARTGVATVTGTLACSKPSILLGLDASMSQTQKTTGRFTTIVKANGGIGSVPCQTNPSSWSVTLTPANGKFEPGSATGTASTAIVVAGFLPSSVTASLKVFQVK